MKSPICAMLGIEFPLVAFSKAGGFGVYGASRQSPEVVEQELNWIDAHIDGKPYGIDVLMPENMATAGEKNVTYNSLEARVPPQHRSYAKELLAKYGIAFDYTRAPNDQPQPFDHGRAMATL